MSTSSDTTTLAACQNDVIVYPAGYVKSSSANSDTISLTQGSDGTKLSMFNISADNINLDGAISHIKMQVFDSSKNPIEPIEGIFVYLIFERSEGVISPVYLTQEEWEAQNNA